MRHESVRVRVMQAIGVEQSERKIAKIIAEKIASLDNEDAGPYPEFNKGPLIIHDTASQTSSDAAPQKLADVR